MEWDLLRRKGLVMKFTHNTVQDDHTKKSVVRLHGLQLAWALHSAVALGSAFLNRNIKRNWIWRLTCITHFVWGLVCPWLRESMWVPGVSHKDLMWFARQGKLLLTSTSTGPPEKNQTSQKSCSLVVQEDTNIIATTPTSWIFIFFLWCCLSSYIWPDYRSAVLDQTL